MGGFMGIGGSSAKTDRGAQLGARQGLWNIFNYSLPEGQKQEATGVSTTGEALGTTRTALGTLDPAKAYWQKLLTAGRTETAQMAAPAVNAAQDQADAARRQEAAVGTGRGGGTAAVNREAGAATTKNVDDIISQHLFGGRAAGAAGLERVSAGEGTIASRQADIGRTQLSNALSLLGLGTGSVESIMENATKSRAMSYAINKDTAAGYGALIGKIFLTGLGIAGGEGVGTSIAGGFGL